MNMDSFDGGWQGECGAGRLEGRAATVSAFAKASADERAPEAERRRGSVGRAERSGGTFALTGPAMKAA